MGHFVEEGLCWGSFGFSTKLPPNSTISMFGPSPIRHSSRADLVYMCTSTGSAVLGIYSSSPDPSAADVQGFNFCQMLEHSASIQSSAAQSRQEIRHCHNNITSGNFFQNKTLCVNTSTKKKNKNQNPSTTSNPLIGNTNLLSVVVIHTYCSRVWFCNYLGNSSVSQLQLSKRSRWGFKWFLVETELRRMTIVESGGYVSSSKLGLYGMLE